MHVEMDNITIRMSETDLREILQGVERAKKEAPYRRNVLLKSDLIRTRFVIAMNTKEKTNPSLGFEVIIPGANSETRP